MDSNQFKGMLDRAAAVLATMFLGWLVKKGYIGESDSATLLPAIILLPSMIYGWIKNRPTSVLASAAAIVGDDGKKTLVVASPELANSIPATNVQSSEEVKVVSK